MNLKRSIFCAVFLSSFILLQSPAFAEMVSIRGENVNMRSGPGTKYEVLWKIGQGFPLQVTKKSGTWLQVRDFEGSVGWVHQDVTTKEAHAVVQANKGSNKNINIRSAPSTKTGSIVATATYGVVFKVLGKKNGWVQVEHANGVKGWIREDLLWGD